MVKNLVHVTVIVLVSVFMLGLGFGTGVMFDHQGSVVHAQANTQPDFQLITEAWNLIDRNYVDRAAKQSQPLTYGAISGMVNALGDTGHSTFMTPAMVKAQHNYTQGSFEGIGAQLESKNGHPTIIAPFDDSPAQRAGIHAGDVILKVNGTDVANLPIDQVVGKIIGPAGTTVTLTLLDPKTGKISDLTITRAKIVLRNVTWSRIPGTTIADVRLAGFSQGVSRELRQALTDIQQQGMTAVILDLRNNPGGLLNEATGTVSQFLSSGDALLEKDANGQITHVKVRPGGVATDLPMVVLVNRGSASASEIVAGALQDAHRATLIGETTFGTGTVLNEFSLSDGSAMMLAVEEWLTPNGRVIWHKGIMPDQEVILPPGVNPLTPDAQREMTPAQLHASGDQQLLRGLAVLTKSALQPNSPGQLTFYLGSETNVGTRSLALDLNLMMHLAWV